MTNVRGFQFPQEFVIRLGSYEGDLLQSIAVWASTSPRFRYDFFSRIHSASTFSCVNRQKRTAIATKPTTRTTPSAMVTRRSSAGIIRLWSRAGVGWIRFVLKSEQPGNNVTYHGASGSNPSPTVCEKIATGWPTTRELSHQPSESGTVISDFRCTRAVTLFADGHESKPR